MFAINIENLKTIKYLKIFQKTFGLSIVCSRCGDEYKKIFKEKQIEILKIVGLTTNIEEYQKIYDDKCKSKCKSKI